MPHRIAICIEDLETGAPRYTQCVALPPGEPGLSLDGSGAIRWGASDRGPCCALEAASDGRLVLRREAGAPSVQVHRGGRVLEVPADQPVVVLHEDLLQLGGRRLRVHVHGVAPEVVPPTPLPPEEAGGRVVRAAATALALGAAAGLGVTVAAGGTSEAGISSPPPVEVRARPPKIARPRPDAGPPKKTPPKPSKKRPKRPPKKAPEKKPAK